MKFLECGAWSNNQVIGVEDERTLCINDLCCLKVSKHLTEYILSIIHWTESFIFLFKYEKGEI